ncbi:5-dehydro-4-deoxy-D-glucuronate isomerase [Flammeovirga sp. MY04]|uniref:5-dehydro-4-deoxy-D-glucuronate isomerase n=1 Tax=Flammeovirga sp. MY04 TaxID=1191459 RepID=UPI0008062C33|nr:5-dehydro-4-deoxy-D-glucuronate isomerase [Flammeovirga sp. MY04]ANQ50857.1 5-dehydro-4-deoxy-D-glucuronate isomerase [Flammeovirga sp. MY04]
MKHESRYSVHPADAKKYDTQQLREHFLIEKIFEEEEICLTYSHEDRYITGGAKPVYNTLELQPIDPLKADYFLERRELGIVNVGGKGIVIADGDTYTLDFKEALYLGRGVKNVTFKSIDSSAPAAFYLNSTPAHKTFPTKKVTSEEAERVELGSPETSNHRIINKLLVNSVVETCQLQMGMTELKSGSVWNTMPGHVHDRRMEVYFYFELPENQAICHFMGQKEESRHIWMHNHQAVISPVWSMHSGAGTSSYTFIWGMAGENLDYDDMDKIAITDLR